MRLIRAVSCWGNEASPTEALALAVEWGFEAIEGPLTGDIGRAAADAGKQVFAEISTCCRPGEYVPDLRATPQDHLEDFRRKLDAARIHDPTRITVLTGADHWEFGTAVAFYRDLLNVAGGEICIETHRSRPTFHPRVTARLLEEIPALTLTLDVSHWCVVCERQVAEILPWMDPIERRTRHLHARVGYDQGPQAPAPFSEIHRRDLAAHLACWRRVAGYQKSAGVDELTVTPEFGPDGYLHTDPATGRGVASLRDLNREMGRRLLTELV